MSDDGPRCGLCGEPMSPDEGMFQYHGYSGPCPKPPLPKPTVEAVIEYLHRESGGEFWLDIRVDGQSLSEIGPFDTEDERQRAHDDMLTQMRSLGAKDMPVRPQ